MHTTTACKFQLGQTVEVHEVDFKAAGMPRVWVAGVVERIELRNAERGLFDVLVRVEGRLSAWTVGPRGGNKTIRVAA